MSTVSYFCLRPKRAFSDRYGIRNPKGQSRTERASLAWKGMLGPKGILVPQGHLGTKGRLWPERVSVARKGILSWKGILDPKGNSIPKGHSRPEREFFARKVTRGSKRRLLSIISMTVSDRRPSMWFESSIWRFPLMTCIIKDAISNHPLKMSVFLFYSMKVTLTNIFIIIMPVQLTILFYHSSKCNGSCGSSTAR